MCVLQEALTELHRPVNQMMAADLFIAFDNFVTFFQTSECKLLPVANPLDTYDEMTFPRMLPTVEEHRAVLDG